MSFGKQTLAPSIFWSRTWLAESVNPESKPLDKQNTEIWDKYYNMETDHLLHIKLKQKQFACVLFWHYNNSIIIYIPLLCRC